MGNREARKLTRQIEDNAKWQRHIAERRPATRDVLPIGPVLGIRRLQLITCPSFESAHAWEVRASKSEWRLFRTQVVESWPDVQLVGYDPVDFSSEQLSGYFDRIISLTLPLCPDLSGGGGLDGTTHQLAVFGDLYSSWRYQWWSEPPPQWSPLVAIASDMITAFSAVSPPACAPE